MATSKVPMFVSVLVALFHHIPGRPASPTTISVALGGSASLKCPVGNSSRSFWLFRRSGCETLHLLAVGHQVLDNASYSLSDSKSEDQSDYYMLTMRNFSLEMEGIFSCQENDSVNEEFHLKVEEKSCPPRPKIGTRIGTFGTEVVLPCSVSSLDDAMWLFTGKARDKTILIAYNQQLSGGSPYTLDVMQYSGSYIYNLRIEECSYPMEGIYHCRGGNIERTSTNLTVHDLNSSVVRTENITVIASTTVKLHSVVNTPSETIWLFRRNGIESFSVMSTGEILYPQYEDVYNLTVQGSGSPFVMYLNIRVATPELAGDYRCNERGVKKALIRINVEVPPDVTLEWNNTKLEGNLDVITGREYEIRCLATGASPAVSLAWWMNGGPLPAHELFFVGNEGGDVTSSTLRFRPNHQDNELKCSTRGQIAIPSISAVTNVNVMYEPKCRLFLVNITEDIFQLTCFCDANPPVSSYEIYVNGFIYATRSTAELGKEYPSTAYCRAENDVGTSQSDIESYTLEVPTTAPTTQPQDDAPGHTLLVIVAVLSGAFLLVILAVIVSYLHTKRRSVINTYFAGDTHASSVPLATMSERPRHHSPVPTRHMPSNPEGSTYETVPADDFSTLDQQNLSPGNAQLGYEYNAQYFANTATNRVKGNKYHDTPDIGKTLTAVGEVSSCASSFSDSEYFQKQGDVPESQEYNSPFI